MADIAGSESGPGVFHPTLDDDGLSLEELSAAYAELLSRGATPYEEPEVEAAPIIPAAEVSVAASEEPQPVDQFCDLTPKRILEAMLFVGNARNQPLTSSRVASLMRGVRSQEIDDLVQELNVEYLTEGRPYRIASIAEGYWLQLRPELASLRDCFYGRVKEIRLTQSAIDVLAIVAYRQPMTRDDVDRIRGKPSGQMLSQLLRRQLLRLDRAEGKSKVFQYRTTDRFLRLFGLHSLAELPQSQDALAGEEAV